MLIFVKKRVMKTLKEIKSAISSLGKQEREHLLIDLQIGHYKEGSYLSELLSKIDQDRPSKCPYCRSEEIHSKGHHKEVRRLQCRECGKYFMSTSGTALYHIHKKDKWLAYLKCMDEGLSLRESAKLVGISLQTSFRWRHKILSSLSVMQSDRFKGIVESDEIYFNYSEKGKKNLDRPARKRGTDLNRTLKENKVGVLVTADREKHKAVKVLGKGIMNRKALDKVLAGKIDPSAILFSDSYKAYRGFAKREGIKHLEVSKYGKPTLKNKAYHIQTVNNLHMQIRSHFRKFNGVSTKYLQNYLHWFLAGNNKMLKTDEKLKQWLWLCVSVANALQLYSQIGFIDT